MRHWILTVSLAAIAAAQTPNTLTSSEKKAGWKLLFDGKTLQGWNAVPSDAWVVEDGCIKSLPNPRLREDVISKESFGDFELTFEWKVAPGANSGVKYLIQDTVLIDEKQLPERMPFEKQVAYELQHRTAKRDRVQGNGAQVYPVAFEYQVIDDERHSDAKAHASSRAGALYRMVVPSQFAAKPAGEFNQGRIVLRGKHVEHWLNGVKVVDTNLNSPEIWKEIEVRWAPGHPVRELLEKMPKTVCPIGLQHHGDTAWFRNVKIRALGQ